MTSCGVIIQMNFLEQFFFGAVSGYYKKYIGQLFCFAVRVVGDV